MTPDVQHTWNELAELSNDSNGVFDPATITELPAPARRFLTAAIPAGAPLATGVELDMVGRIKLGIWLPFTARQLLCAGTGLVWAADVGPRAMRFVGADSLGPEGAHMQFKLYGRIPIVSATGSDVDRSAAGRLAAETAAWLPQALTPQAGATWRPCDDHRATVTITTPDGPIDVDITIDDQGRVVDIALERWKDSAKPAAHAPFGGTVSSTIDVNGVRLAGSGTVGWDHGAPVEDAGGFFRYRVISARFLTPSESQPGCRPSTSDSSCRSPTSQPASTTTSADLPQSQYSPPGQSSPPSLASSPSNAETAPNPPRLMWHEPIEVERLRTATRLVAGVLLVAIVSCGTAGTDPDGAALDTQPGAAVVTTVDGRLPTVAAVEAVLDEGRRAASASGAITVISVDGRRLQAVTGDADSTGTPTRSTMRFRAGSITKTITAALVLDQVANGQLRLDDVVADIVGPPLRPTPPVTVEMLLAHTSGVFDIGNDGDPIADIAELTDLALIAEVDELIAAAGRGEPIVASARLVVGLAETHPRDFRPGAGYSYSNTNYQLAGLVIEQVADSTLDTVLRHRIIEPLGLAATSLAPYDSTSLVFRGTATDLDTGEPIDATDDLLAFGNGASGGLITTADELLTVLDSVVHGAFLPETLRDVMVDMTTESAGSYGFGIAPYELACGSFVGHEGRVNGITSIALVNRDQPGHGLVVAINSTIGRPDLTDIADELLCTS